MIRESQFAVLQDFIQAYNDLLNGKVKYEPEKMWLELKQKNWYNIAYLNYPEYQYDKNISKQKSIIAKANCIDGSVEFSTDKKHLTKDDREMMDDLSREFMEVAIKYGFKRIWIRKEGDSMRKGQKPFMLQMSEHEKEFISEMAWRNKMSIAQYVRMMIHEQMEKHPDVAMALAKKEA